jgi:hypothetical protein
MCQFLAACGRQPKLMRKKTIPFHGLFVPELCERNGLFYGWVKAIVLYL